MLTSDQADPDVIGAALQDVSAETVAEIIQDGNKDVAEAVLKNVDEDKIADVVEKLSDPDLAVSILEVAIANGFDKVIEAVVDKLDAG